ncbi:dihydroneopterin aldolase [bacterium]|nr:dihydroneopterin aldolase [bacterium]
MVDCIRLTGIDVYAFHGALAAERELGQRFVIDVDLWADIRKAAATDSIDDALDYTEVHARIVELAGSAVFHLLEALADRIAAMLLDEFPLEGVLVTVHKPNPPIRNFMGSVSVTVDRRAEDRQAPRPEGGETLQ